MAKLQAVIESTPAAWQTVMAARRLPGSSPWFQHRSCVAKSIKRQRAAAAGVECTISVGRNTAETNRRHVLTGAVCCDLCDKDTPSSRSPPHYFGAADYPV